MQNLEKKTYGTIRKTTLGVGSDTWEMERLSQFKKKNTSVTPVVSEGERSNRMVDTGRANSVLC